MSKLHSLTQAQDVSDHLLVLVANCTEDWFREGPLSESDFIDRLCVDYLNPEGWEIEQFDTPAVRKIMRHARKVRSEL